MKNLNKLGNLIKFSNDDLFSNFKFNNLLFLPTNKQIDVKAYKQK